MRSLPIQTWGVPSLADAGRIVLTKLVHGMEGGRNVRTDESDVDALLFRRRTIQHKQRNIMSICAELQLFVLQYYL